MITSRTIPAVAPGTSAASVGTSARSESCVAMMTLNMNTRPRSRPHHAGNANAIASG